MTELDKYAGQPGRFYVDPETQTRITEEEWLAKQSAKPSNTKEAADDEADDTNIA